VSLFERKNTKWHPIQRQTASDATQDDWYHAVALDGTRALVGAPRSDVAGLDAGQVYGLALSRSRPALTSASSPNLHLTRWSAIDVDGESLIVGSQGGGCGGSQVRTLTDSGPAGLTLGPRFINLRGADLGSSVAIDGDTAIAGAPRSSPTIWVDHGGCASPGRSRGEVFFYERSGGAWAQTQAIPPHYGGQFGGAVALEGDTAIVGESGGGWPQFPHGQGRVVVFARGPEAPHEWSAQEALTGSDSDGSDWFGAAVALDSSVLVVGAPGASAHGVDSGAVYVFERIGTSFVETAKLSDPGGTSFSNFGGELALDGDLLAVVASSYPHQLHPVSATVHVYARNGAGWNQQATLRPCNAFGVTSIKGVALRGDRLVVTTDDSVLVYLRAGQNWILAETLFTKEEPYDAAFLGDRIVVTTARALEVFELPRSTPSFCDALDGSLASCPCANVGLPDAGCDTPGGRGGIGLDVVAQSTGVPNRATLSASGFPPGATASGTLLRSRSLEPNGPAVFGDGLRCIGLPISRVNAGQGTGGALTFTIRHAPTVGPGTFFYQLHVRSLPAMHCTPAAFNMSSGRALTWQ
jgi:hypothetical protein